MIRCQRRTGKITLYGKPDSGRVIRHSPGLGDVCFAVAVGLPLLVASAGDGSMVSVDASHFAVAAVGGVVFHGSSCL